MCVKYSLLFDFLRSQRVPSLNKCEELFIKEKKISRVKGLPIGNVIRLGEGCSPPVGEAKFLSGEKIQFCRKVNSSLDFREITMQAN